MTVYTLFNQAQTTTYTGLGGALTLTTEFTMSANAALTGIWFYSPSGSAGVPAQCGVYAASTQTLVASNTSPSWSGAAGSGWIKCTFDGSVTLQAGSTYFVAVQLGTGVTAGKQTVFWTTGPGSGGFSNAVMSAPNYATSNLQGAVESGNNFLSYPTVSENGSFYGPDVEVTVSSAAPTPTPIMACFP